MCIDDFILACSIDGSPDDYFTFHKNSLILMQCKTNALYNINHFHAFIPFMESIISHESIHVVIEKLENIKISESMDNLELELQYKETKVLTPINNMLFDNDICGLAIPSHDTI